MDEPTTGFGHKLLAKLGRGKAGGDDPIPLFGSPSADSFDPDGYLWANPDMADAARASSDPDFASHHFESFGSNEQRQQLLTEALPRVAEARMTKLARLRERSPNSLTALEVHRESICGHIMEALKPPGPSSLPVPFDRISYNLYDPDIDAWIDNNPTSLFLDAGAGLRNVYRPNVVNAEIAMLPSTDVLCFGDSLPFDDDTFDGVMSFAVLEHVENPFAVTEQLVRVVRPGGRIIVDWPFLVPLHGYPHHYFNATPEGAKLAFERIERASVIESCIPPNFHPVFALRWILDEWRAGMSDVDRDGFLRLTVSDILAAFASTSLSDPWSAPVLREPWVSGLPESSQTVISAGTRLIVTKT